MLCQFSQGLVRGAVASQWHAPQPSVIKCVSPWQLHSGLLAAQKEGNVATDHESYHEA